MTLLGYGWREFAGSFEARLIFYCLVVAIVVVLFLFRFGRAKRRGGFGVLGYGWNLKWVFTSILAALMTLFGFTVMVFRAGGLTGWEWWPAGVVAILVACVAMATLHYHFFEIRFNAKGVVRSGWLPLGRSVSIPWNELKAVRRHKEKESYTLESDRISIVVGCGLHGQEELVEYARDVIRERNRERKNEARSSA